MMTEKAREPVFTPEAKSYFAALFWFALVALCLLVFLVFFGPGMFALMAGFAVILTVARLLN